MMVSSRSFEISVIKRSATVRSSQRKTKTLKKFLCVPNFDVNVFLIPKVPINKVEARCTLTGFLIQ